MNNVCFCLFLLWTKLFDLSGRNGNTSSQEDRYRTSHRQRKQLEQLAGIHLFLPHTICWLAADSTRTEDTLLNVLNNIWQHMSCMRAVVSPFLSWRVMTASGKCLHFHCRVPQRGVWSAAALLVVKICRNCPRWVGSRRCCLSKRLLPAAAGCPVVVWRCE